MRYCLHVQQRLLQEQWPIKLAEHQMARTVSLGDLEGSGPGGQVLFNGLRVRMAINTGAHPSSCCCLTQLPHKLHDAGWGTQPELYMHGCTTPNMCVLCISCTYVIRFAKD